MFSDSEIDPDLKKVIQRWPKLSDEIKNAILKIALFFLLIFLAGCTLFADKRVVIKPRPKTRQIDRRDSWKALASFIKKHFKTDMAVNEIKAELVYQEYLLTKDKLWDCLKNHK